MVELIDFIQALGVGALSKCEGETKINNINYKVTAYTVGENLIRIDLKRKDENNNKR